MKVSTIELSIPYDGNKCKCNLPVGAKILPVGIINSSGMAIISFIDNNNEKKEQYIFAIAEVADETYDFAATAIKLYVPSDSLKEIFMKDVKSSLEAYHIFYKKA